MILTLPFVLGFIASASARCGTRKPSEEMKTLHAKYQAMGGNSAKLPMRQVENFVINTYVHIITAGSTKEEGSVNETQIYSQVKKYLVPLALHYHRAKFQLLQINVLNNAYTGTGFSFNLVTVVNVMNATWREIDQDSQLEYEMKSQLRQGYYRDLNVYIDTIAVNEEHLLGYA
jgi:hypothetical protein